MCLLEHIPHYKNSTKIKSYKHTHSKQHLYPNSNPIQYKKYIYIYI